MSLVTKHLNYKQHRSKYPCSKYPSHRDLHVNENTDFLPKKGACIFEVDDNPIPFHTTKTLVKNSVIPLSPK